jgi:hypothetical protein
MSTTQSHSSQRFRLDKATVGDITLLTLHGVLDEGFEGQKVAESIKGGKVVVSLRDVRRFASWGMAEWVNFLRVPSDIYLVECSTYATNQMNLVTGLLAQAKLVSFYAPYRCGSCSEEFETLTLVPAGRAAVRELATSELVCSTCGGHARMEYPASMCEAIADRPAFDMDDDVVELLRDKFKYNLTPDVTRFRAHRRVGKGAVYLRMTGNLATLPPAQLAAATEGTTVVDLANVLYDPAELAPWHEYLRTALANGSSLQLLDCPPGFLERAVPADSLSPKFVVRSFVLQYFCAHCNTSTVRIVDVAANLEYLITGTVPATPCDTCKTPLPPPEMDPGLLQRLPARARDSNLEKFLASVRGEPAAKLEDCLVARPVKAARPAAGGSRGIYLAAGLGGLILVGLVVVVVMLSSQKTESAPQPAQLPRENPQVGGGQPAGSAFQRPDWIVSDVPSSALCHDVINRLVCVGVSSYRATRADAVAEANDAALEELVNVVGLKISVPYFKDTVLAGYSDSRSKALSKLSAVDMDRNTPEYAAADEIVRQSRKRVVEVLQASAGAAVPAQRSDWYWEEYTKEKGAGTEVLVFIRYDINLEAVKALVDKYSAMTPVGGGFAMTAFPALAWQFPDFTGGAVLTKLGKALATAGIAAGEMVIAVNDQRVVDAPGLVKRFDEAMAAGSAKLSVKAGLSAPQVITIRK